MSKFSRSLKHKNAYQEKRHSLRVSFTGLNCAGDHTWSSIWIPINNISSSLPWVSQRKLIVTPTSSGYSNISFHGQLHVLYETIWRSSLVAKTSGQNLGTNRVLVGVLYRKVEYTLLSMILIPSQSPSLPNDLSSWPRNLRGMEPSIFGNRVFVENW